MESQGKDAVTLKRRPHKQGEKVKLELRGTPTKKGRKGEAGKAQQRESHVLQGGEMGSRVTVPPPKTV